MRAEVECPCCKSRSKFYITLRAIDVDGTTNLYPVLSALTPISTAIDGRLSWEALEAIKREAVQAYQRRRDAAVAAGSRPKGAVLLMGKVRTA